MTEKTLERRYRLLAAGFRDAPRAPIWASRIGADFREALDLLSFVLARDLALAPADLDREHLGLLLGTLLPGRLSGEESYRNDIVDLLEDFLLFVIEEEGLTHRWELLSAIDAERTSFERAMANPDRPALRAPSHAPDRRPAAKIGRNDPCPCGSGRKYKQCCLRR